jgi:hypothetical protein
MNYFTGQPRIPIIKRSLCLHPADPLSFVAGCADGSVRFFRLEGVELPVTH